MYFLHACKTSAAEYRQAKSAATMRDRGTVNSNAAPNFGLTAENSHEQLYSDVKNTTQMNPSEN